MSLHGLSALASIFFLAFQLPAVKSQDFYSTQIQHVSEAVTSQTGLTLPTSSENLRDFISIQMQSNCEAMDIKWTALPGHRGPLPEKEAERLNLPQTFAFEGRPQQLGYKPVCRVDTAGLPFFGVIIFGTTRSGEIRGMQAGSDPRRMIVECPELFGGMSTPETKCGYFIMPEASLRVIMPQDPEIERLEFFTRTYDDAGHWHLVKAGTLKLPQDISK
jgi:hypothetical protein